MKKVNIIIITLMIFLISGCGSEQHNIRKAQPSAVEKYLRADKPVNFNFKPLKKKISILDLEKVSLSAKAISYKDAIVQILKSKSLNVAFDNRLDKYVQNQTINISLDNVSLRNALNTITGIAGVSWEKRQKTVWITPFESKIYDIGFLGVVRSSKATLGGDVLGGSSGSSDDNDVTSPLQGSFTLESSSNTKKGDIYKVLEDNIKNMLSANGHFTLDQSSGILMVTDEPNRIKLVTKYINAISNSYKRQVMIEAKIIEVNLTKNWQLGIDWNVLARTVNLGQRTIDFGNSIPAMVFNINKIKASRQFNATINALSKFGSLKLVSEPHLRVMNAQPAILSVGRSVSFIKKIEVTTETVSGGTSTTTPTVDISSIFDGIVFGITPFIKENGKVLLRIVPIKSKLVSLDEKEVDGNTYTLPTVDLREASTVVNVESGNIIAIGGLVSKTKQRNNSGVPFLSDLPIFGSTFKQQEHLSNNVELVILLKPIVLH